MEIRVSIAQWEGEKLTVYASTQGISKCRIDIAHDLKMPLEKVRVVCKYMGGGFGNKNQIHDFDLMAAMLAKKAGAPVKLEFTRKEDYVAVHGRWPTKQYYKVGVKRDGTLTAIQFRGYSGMGPYRKSSGDIAGVELYQCPNVEKLVYPVLTNMAVSANFRGPAYPQGIFGIESLMDDVAYELKMDPDRFPREEHDAEVSRRAAVHQLRPGGLRSARRGGVRMEEALARAGRGRWSGQARRRDGDGRVRRGVGRSSAVIHLNSKGEYELHVGVTDVGTAAKTTMALIAAEELGVPLAKVDVVCGDTEVCPYSVGESGSRTTTHTGYAVIEAAKDLKQQIADKGLPARRRDPHRQRDARSGASSKMRALRLRGAFRGSGSGHRTRPRARDEVSRRARQRTHHQSAHLRQPGEGRRQRMGIGMALHEELLYDPRTACR